MNMMKSSLIVVMLVSSMFVISCNDQKSNDTLSKNKVETKSLSSQASFEVSGSCGMCENRIESTVSKIDGIINAKYDLEKQILTFNYNSDKVKLDDVKQKLATVGHDTKKFKAKDEVYENLPGCCRYRN